MFKHEDLDDIVNDKAKKAKDSIWNVMDETDNDDEANGNETLEDILEMTFQNPSTSKATNANEVELYFNFNCDLCIFKTKDKTRFIRHRKEIHSIQGKYVCTKCQKSRKNLMDASVMDVEK